MSIVESALDRLLGAADDATGKRVDATPATVFEALDNRRRRLAIHAYVTADRPLELGELSRALAAVENDCHVEMVTADERKVCYVGLYQVHLPHLAEADILETISERQNRYRATPTAERLDEIASEVEHACVGGEAPEAGIDRALLREALAAQGVIRDGE